MNDTRWIAECPIGIAAAALELLDEIIEEMVLLKDPIVISPHVYDMGAGQEDNVRNARMSVLNMLVKRGALRNAEYRHERGPTGGGEGFWIDADEAIVRETRKLLDDRITGRAPKAASPKPVAASPKTATPVSARRGRVFVVCGRDKAATQTVARFLEKLKVKPVLLEEQPNQGRTIIEKLEHYAANDYAVVILTPDDEGRLRGPGDLKPRPRQNVVGELFYFTALGRSRVCALVKGEMELPSDYDGFGYTTMDDHGGWQLKLAQEMRAAGVQADYSKIIP